MSRIIARASELAGGLAELVWPARCAGCDRPDTLLCDDCAERLPRIDQLRACPRCGAPFGSLVCTECSRCLEREEGGGPLWQPWDELDGVCCFGVLAWPLADAVRAYKDAGERRLAPLLGGLLAEALRATSAFDLADADAVAFVPATPEAFARRGYDHMDDVARALSRELGLPLADVLARRAPRDQRRLSRAGRLGAVGRGCVALGDLSGARLLLVDDVLTTGATLADAACALRAAGARVVHGSCVARAW